VVAAGVSVVIGTTFPISFVLVAAVLFGINPQQKPEQFTTVIVFGIASGLLAILGVWYIVDRMLRPFYPKPRNDGHE